MRRKVSRTRADIALHDAAMQGDVESAQKAVADGANVNSQEEEHSITPLLWACSFGHLDVVKYLIDVGADTNYADENLGNPLHNAVSGGFAEIVRFLLERGASLDALDGCGFTPLEAAIVYGEMEKTTRRSIISSLLDRGYDVNARNLSLNGRTPLMSAVEAAAESSMWI